MRAHHIPLLLLCLVLGTSSLTAQPFRLSPLTDGILAGSALTANGTAWLLETASAKPAAGTLSLDSINPFDRMLVYSYNETLDHVGTALEVASLGTVAALSATDSGQWGTIAVMYAESVLLSNGLKNIAKATITRARPYRYFDSAPEADDQDSSFFSGHTTLAFTGATFTSYVFSAYFPDSPWKIPVIAASYALATATAASRIASGSHFLSDVLVGAAVGSLSGFLVPFLHRTFPQPKESEKPIPKQFYLTASLVPDGFWVRCDF